MGLIFGKVRTFPVLIMEIEANLQSCKTVLRLKEKQTKPQEGKFIIAFDSSFVDLSNMR